jgi:hypothetical protein
VHLHACATGSPLIRCRIAVPLSSPRKSAIEIEKKDSLANSSYCPFGVPRAICPSSAEPPISRRQCADLSVGALKFVHETDESFEGDGIIEGDAHAAEVLLFDLA